MPIADCFDTLLINGTDIRTWAYITNAEGLLGNGFRKGDVIEQDWSNGAIWQQGPWGTYSFDVPVVMTSRDQDTAIGQLRALQGYVGNQVTLTRQITSNTIDISETCQAVMASAVEVVWSFDSRAAVRAVLIWQQLSGIWTRV